MKNRNFLSRIGDFFKRTFSKGLDTIKKNSGAAIKVVSALKSFVESPVASYIVSIIPGDLDAAILAKLRERLPSVLGDMALAHGIIHQNKSQAEVMQAIIEHLRSRNVEGRAGFWIELSGRVNVALSDNEITLAEGVGIAQLVYAEIKNR